jgi:glucose dehydrogenase
MLAALYQEHPMLREFLFLETKAPKAQRYRRESNNRWTIYLLTADDEVELVSLGICFPVIDLYWRTRFKRRESQ